MHCEPKSLPLVQDTLPLSGEANGVEQVITKDDKRRIQRKVYYYVTVAAASNPIIHIGYVNFYNRVTTSASMQNYMYI